MLELARESDWERVRLLSVQLHDLHVTWRPDIYFHCDEPYPKVRFLEEIRNRMVYVAKIENAVVGYVILSVKGKEGPGCISQRALLLESICVDETVRGHGIGSEMHEDPQIPNYGKPGKGPRLQEGMTLAIEPMICQGSYEVDVLLDDWTAVTVDGGLAAHYENTVVITDGEPELLTL